MSTTQEPLKLQIIKKELSTNTLSWLVDQHTTTAHAYPLSVEIRSNINMEKAGETNQAEDYDANILIFQISGSGFDPNQGDMFVRVADIVDMDELPIKDYFDFMNAKSTTKASPYYRSNKFTLFCRSVEECNTVWSILKQEVKSFVSSYNAAHSEATDQSEETITIS